MKTTPPYQQYVPGLQLALDDVRYKLERARVSTEWVKPVPAFVKALEETENTLQMYLNQCQRGEKPGLFSKTI